MKKKIYIYADGIEKEIFKNSLRNKKEYEKTIYPILNFEEEARVSELRNLNASNHYVIVHGVGERGLFKSQGWKDSNIIVYYNPSLFLKSHGLRFIKMLPWGGECLLKYIDKKISKNKLTVISKIKISRDVISLKKKVTDKKVIFWGVNKFSEYYIKKLKGRIRIWGCCAYDFDNIQKFGFASLIKDKKELVLENPAQFIVYILDEKMRRKTEWDLISIGFKKSQIFLSGRYRTSIDGMAGTKALNAIDPIIGYSRADSEYPGFIVFGNKKNCDIKIVTLGGSTSDPILENVRSYSEILYEMLSNVGYRVCIYAGGLSTYTCAQECLKLIKDVLQLKPDIVISYSGFNDFYNYHHYEKEHPFIRSYMPSLMEQLVKAGILNEMQNNVPIETVTLGIPDISTRAEFWIKCEKIMYAVCSEMNIKFHGILQPSHISIFDYSTIGDTGIKESQNAYQEAKLYIKQHNYSWLHDMTDIFDGNEKVYFDNCHVYEGGNRIIARHIMKIILDSIQREERDQQ